MHTYWHKQARRFLCVYKLKLFFWEGVNEEWRLGSVCKRHDMLYLLHTFFFFFWIFVSIPGQQRHREKYECFTIKYQMVWTGSIHWTVSSQILSVALDRFLCLSMSHPVNQSAMFALWCKAGGHVIWPCYLETLFSAGNSTCVITV